LVTAVSSRRAGSLSASAALRSKKPIAARVQLLLSLLCSGATI
jgi:hypothetical protein